ncbi:MULTISPECIES: hypothetical protein [unclassified Microcoleus]
MIALINSIACTSNFSGQNVARMPPAIPQYSIDLDKLDRQILGIWVNS